MTEKPTIWIPNFDKDNYKYIHGALDFLDHAYLGILINSKNLENKTDLKLWLFRDDGELILAENNVPETCYFGMDDNNSFDAVTVYWYTIEYTSASQTMDYVIKKFNRVALTKLIIYLKENYNIKSNGKLFGEGKNSYKGVFKNIWDEYKSDDLNCLISYLNYYYIFE